MIKEGIDYIAIPPGETIKEQINQISMTQKELAIRMDLSEKHLSHLINGDVFLTQDVAYKLEMVLGLPASFWNNLESIYREDLKRIEEETKLEDEKKILKKLPYLEMSKLTWVPVIRREEEKIINLRKFFEVADLKIIENDVLFPRLACRRLSLTEKSDYALLCWIQKAKLEARKIETDKISISSLKGKLTFFRELTKEEPETFLPILREELAKCGIALVVLPHLKGSYLQGATCLIKNKIIVGLTLRGKTNDKFWFSFFHELAHIILGHLDKGEGLTPKEEKEADLFAENVLIPSDSYISFVKVRDYTPTAIKTFASSLNINPALIVGRLQKDKIIGQEENNSLKKRFEFNYE